MTEDFDPVDVLELLEDEYAREILVTASAEPMSARALSDACDASLPTVYRRVEALEAADLLAVQTLPDEEGHHYKVYSTRVERFAVEIADGSMDAELVLREEHVADRFTRLYEGFR
ncbi:MAG: helix-turn-helix domain-containing protein [Haloferacaceae archaeon]